MASYEEKMYDPLNKTLNIQRDRILELEDIEQGCIDILKAINSLNHQGRYEEAKALCNGFLSGIQKGD